MCEVQMLISPNNYDTANYSTLKCEFHVVMSVFDLICVIPPTANLTNDISTLGLPVGGKRSV